MYQQQIVVVDRLLDGAWRDSAEKLFAIGEAEDRFNAFGVSYGRDRGLFAFIDEETDAEDAVGVLAYYACNQNDQRRILKLNTMCVRPSHRRLEVAKTLIHEAYKIAVQEKCSFVEADVKASNYPMLRLIHKCGYQSTNPVHFWKRVEENRDPDDLGL